MPSGPTAITFCVAAAATILLNYLCLVFLGYRSMLPASWLLQRLNLRLLAATSGVALVGYAILAVAGNDPAAPLESVLNLALVFAKWLFALQAAACALSALVKTLLTIIFYGSGWSACAWRMLGLRIVGAQASMDFRFYVRSCISLTLLGILWAVFGLGYLLFPMLYLISQVLYVLSRTLRPPIILLCSPSGQEGTDLYRTLVRAARFARVVSMVDGPLSGGMVEEFIFDNFRTGMAGWEGILVALTQFSIIVVLDGRNVTPHLMFEARRGVSPLVAHKTIVVVDEETDSPILDRLVQSGDLPNKDCVRVLTPARLETAIRDLIESSDRVPVARVRLDKGPSGDRIAFLPGEPAPPRFALGDVWSNPLARGFEVSYQVPHEASVRIDLCGKAGDRIHTLVHGRQAAGRYSVSSSGRDSSGSTFPAGAYQVSLEADGERHVKVFEVPEHSE